MAEIPLKRRLATVLAADAVGYSRMMSEDEEGTLRVLAGHREVIDEIIASREGRIFGTAGDSVLAEFESPVEAVRCAVEIQSALRTRNYKLPEDRRMQFRIGINLGDVTIKDGDLLGDGVNVAARLEGISEPGGICVSAAVYEQTLGKLTLGFADLGDQELKNITRPVRAYSVYEGEPVVRRPARRTRRAPPAAWAAGIAAILVLAGTGWWLLQGTKQSAAPDPEQVLWEAVRDSTDPAELAAFLRQFPDGTHGQLARLRLAKLQADADRQREQQAALARAQEEAAVARAEAEREKARLQLEALQAELARTKADAERAQAAVEADRRQLEQARAQQHSSDPPQARVTATAPVTTHPYDGQWALRFHCAAFRDLPAFDASTAVRINNGAVSIDHGSRGEPGFFSARGQVADDGEVVITGERYAPRMERNVPVDIRGRFTGEQWAGRGVFGKRPCELTMVRAGR